MRNRTEKNKFGRKFPCMRNRDSLMSLLHYIVLLVIIATVECQTSELYVATTANTTCTPPCGLTVECPCTAIQDAINNLPTNTTDTYTILVFPGNYTGTGNFNINFYGKVVTLRAIEPDNTTIKCIDNNYAFVFDSGENQTTRIIGFELFSCKLKVQNSE